MEILEYYRQFLKENNGVESMEVLALIIVAFVLMFVIIKLTAKTKETAEMTGNSLDKALGKGLKLN